MQTIKLTLTKDNTTIRVNPDQIIAYWDSTGVKGSDVLLSISDFDTGVSVKETADEIDKLLAEVL